MSEPKLWALLAAYHGEETKWARANTIRALCDAGLIRFLGNSAGGNYGTTPAGNEWIETHQDSVTRLRAIQ
ncbi:hypothetical protein [Mycobacterium sp. MUNTM1]